MTRIVILTEDEPLFAAEGFRLFLSALDAGSKPVLAVIADFSPAGSKLSHNSTVSYLRKTFGLLAFLRVGMRYLRCRLDPRKRVEAVFRENGIRVLRTSGDVNAPETVEAIREARPDVIVSATMHGLYGSPLLDVAPCLNLHLSLLPRHAGLMPVFWALHDGDKETGVTVFRATERIDGGDILVQKRVPIRVRRLIPLYRELKNAGMAAMAEAVLLNRQTIPPFKPVDPGDGSVNRKPELRDVKAFKMSGNAIL